MASWTLAHNLQVRHDEVKAVYPSMDIGEVGDLAHQEEASDHNPDSRHIVHAIDIMTETDAGNDGAAAIILAWLLDDTSDLQYVIHDRVIRTRANAFRPAKYSGSDPHTNHIHVSGKHGTVGKNAATGTGYDVAAESHTPEGIPMPLTAADKAWITSEIKALVPTAATTAKAVWDAAIKNAVVSTPTKVVTGMARDFLSTLHWENYASWLSLGQPANQWPQPAKPAVAPIAEQTAAATAAQPTN